MEPPSSSTKPAPIRPKLKFAPKPPPRRVKKPHLPKPEVVEDEDAIFAKDLRRRLDDASETRLQKNEKKAVPAQVAFGHGAGATSMRSYGRPRPRPRDISGPNGATDSPVIGLEEKEYKEPWDYYSNYPLTLPMRKPYSGNPEHLDRCEFGGSSEEGNLTAAAEELGFLEENSEGAMLFFQFPEALPMSKRMSSAGGGPVRPAGVAGRHHRVCTLDELPAGFMGKMVIYQSGIIKMKLGDTVYDITSGLSCGFAQDVVALNAEEKKCCALGEVRRRAVVTPDIDSVISGMSEL